MSWSPDGKKISAAVFESKEMLSAKVAIINVESGTLDILGEKKWLWIGKTIWLKDGSGIALIGYGAESPNLTDEIWFVAHPTGEARVITNGMRGVVGMSLTDDLESIVATRLNRITSSHTATLDNLDEPAQINKSATGESLLQLGAEWTIDGKILFGKTENGNADIWQMNSDGSEKKRLTSDKSADYSPRMSFDGKYIFFSSNRGGVMNIWRMDSNGENPIQITTRGNFSAPSVSMKGDYLFHIERSFLKPERYLFRTDFDGKDSKQITNVSTHRARVSPDGKYILCFYPKAGTPADANLIRIQLAFTILSAESGEVTRQFDNLKTRAFPLAEWAGDSKSFFYVEGGKTPILWRQAVAGGDPVKLKEWNNEKVYQIAISKDAKSIFYETGEEVNSVIQLKNASESTR